MAVRKIPLWGVGPDGICECPAGESCGKSTGKHPTVANWQEWTEGVAEGQPYGVVTGAPSGVVVIDIDEKDGKNGLRNWAEWVAEQGQTVPPTLTVRTPTGGFHLYFAHPGFPVRNTQGRPCVGVDIRGDGGQVVGPGVNLAGGTYEVVLAMAPSKLPPWLLSALLRNQAKERQGTEPYTCTASQMGRNLLEARALIDRWGPAIEGQGGSTHTFILAGKLRRELGLPRPVVLELLEEWNSACQPPWGEADLMRKIIQTETEMDWGYLGADWTMIERPRPEVERAPEPKRRTKNPAHKYSVQNGDTAQGQRRKVAFDDLIAGLKNHPDWEGVLQYDEFQRKVFAVDPPVDMRDSENGRGLSDEDISGVRLWLSVNGILAPVDDIRRAVLKVAHTNAFHTVVEYLDSLGPAENRGAILDGLSARVFGTADPVYDDMLRKFLVAAVRRVLQPGCQVDTMLVLQGGQGVGKSRFVRAMFPWYRESLPDLRSKDACGALRGCWAVEVGELDAMLRQENQTAKEFLSRTVDAYRPPYERAEVEVPRQVVFVGTTNDDDFLRDATGDRRYWPIPIPGKVDIEYVKANRDRIWAAAYELARDPRFEHHYEDDGVLEVVRSPFVEVDAWSPKIEAWLRGRKEFRTAGEVFTGCIGQPSDLKGVGRRETNRVSSILRRLGCKVRVRKVDGHNQKFWEVPSHLSEMLPPVPGRDPTPSAPN
jgi:hypothetical protein